MVSFEPHTTLTDDVVI